jgi:hypothetical protein
MATIEIDSEKLEVIKAIPDQMDAWIVQFYRALPNGVAVDPAILVPLRKLIQELRENLADL